MQVGDEQIYASDKEPVKLEMKLQCQLLEADQWLGTNGMITNPGKYQAMVLGNTNYTFSFTVNGTNVPVKDNIDLLGVNNVYVSIWGENMLGYATLFSDSLIIHAALTQPEHLILVSWMSLETQWKTSWKHGRVSRSCLKLFQTDANFLNLHIDKATKTRGDKQLFNHTFYETNFKPKLFTANVEWNGTVIKLPKTEKPILFQNFKFSLNGGDAIFPFVNKRCHFRDT